MAMKNDAKFEEELTCRSKTDKKNLSNFDTNTPKFQKFALSLAALKQLCLMELKVDAKFERRLTCAFKNDMRNFANFQRLKNSNFILESKMTELN